MKIYDCFPFFNELDLLEIRLELLYPYVDFFVICECCKTQTGKDKPFYYELNRERYSKYADKIIHLKIENPPKVIDNYDWSIEHYQRSYIMKGIADCNPDDLICISDIDEFYNPDLLLHPELYSITPINKLWGTNSIIKQCCNLLGIYKKLLKPRSMDFFLRYTPVAVKCVFSKYYFNYCSSKMWYGTVITKFKYIQNLNTLREKREILPYVKKISGWHFSSCGGETQFYKKIDSVIEGHYLKDFLKDRDFKSVLSNSIENQEIFNYNPKLGIWRKCNPEDLSFPNIENIKNKYPIFFIE